MYTYNACARNSMQAKSIKISNEVEVLQEHILKDFKKIKVGAIDGYSTNSEDQSNAMNVYGDQALESTLQLLELEDQIEKKVIMLKTLQDLDYICKWSDALEQVENAITCLKVIAFNENCIRMSLQTYLPELQGLMSQQNIEGVYELSELNHELFIEVLEGGMDIRNIERCLAGNICYGPVHAAVIL